jgi:hypothetical protein
MMHLRDGPSVRTTARQNRPPERIESPCLRFAKTARDGFRENKCLKFQVSLGSRVSRVKKSFRCGAGRGARGGVSQRHHSSLPRGGIGRVSLLFYYIPVTSRDMRQYQEINRIGCLNLPRRLWFALGNGRAGVAEMSQADGSKNIPPLKYISAATVLLSGELRASEQFATHVCRAGAL